MARLRAHQMAHIEISTGVRSFDGRVSNSQKSQSFGSSVLSEIITSVSSSSIKDQTHLAILQSTKECRQESYAAEQMLHARVVAIFL